MSRVIIDGENGILGRLSSYAAKQALLGKEVVIVNSEKIIITGSKQDILKRYLSKRAKGGASMRGPYFPTTPEKIVKRTIRGMLEYKKGRGREALKRIKCYIGTPKEFENEKKIKGGKRSRGITIGELSKLLRGGK